MDNEGSLIITQQDAGEGYPFEFIPVSIPTDIHQMQSYDNSTSAYKGIYDLQGRRLNGIPQRGIYILNGKKFVR